MNIKGEQKITLIEGDINNSNIKFKMIQKLTDVIKNTLGYKNITSNIFLYPGMKEVRQLLTFFMETISKFDTKESSQEKNEGSFLENSIKNSLNEWRQKFWIIPEFKSTTMNKLFQVENTSLPLSIKLKGNYNSSQILSEKMGVILSKLVAKDKETEIDSLGIDESVILEAENQKKISLLKLKKF